MFGTLLGIDTLCTGTDGCIPWSLASKLMAKGVRMTKTSGIVQLAKGATEIRGTMAVLISIEDRSRKRSMEFLCEMHVIDMNDSLPVLSWETCDRLKVLMSGEHVVVNQEGEETFRTPLVSEREYRDYDRDACVAAIQVMDRNTIEAKKTMDFFGISPTKH